MTRFLPVCICMLLYCCLVRESLASGLDSFSSGFYTRGVDAAAYVDREDSAVAPFYMPLGSRWMLLPRITVSAVYEDNAALPRDDPKPGASVTILPGVLLLYGRPDRNHLYIDAGLIIPVHNDSEMLDEKNSYLLTAGGVYRTGKSSLTGRLGYRRIENIDTQVGDRLIRVNTTGDLGAEVRLSRKSSVGAMASVSMHDFESEQYIDYVRYYVGGRYYYRVTPKSDGYLQLGAGHDALRQNSVDESGNADFFDISVGFRGKQTPKSSVSGQIGYRWRSIQGDDLKDVNHYIAALDAKTSPFGLTTFSAGITADLRPAVQAEGVTTVDQRITVGASRRLFRESVRGWANLFFGSVDYYGSSVRPEDRPLVTESFYDSRTDHYRGYSFGVDWWMRHRLSMGFFYSYFEKTDGSHDRVAVEYQRLYHTSRFGLRLSWNY